MGNASAAAEVRIRLQLRGDASPEDLLALGEFLQLNRKFADAIEVYARTVQLTSRELNLRFAAGAALADALELQGRAEDAALCRWQLLLEFESNINPSALPPGSIQEAWLILALSVADDYARAGLYPEAVLRWNELRERDLIDSAIVRSRLAYGLCMMGFPIRAQALLADEILGESDIDLIDWMREINIDLTPLMDVLWERRNIQPDNMILVRLLAAGAPDRAGDALREAALRTDDPEIRAEVVRFAMAAGPDVALETAGGMATSKSSLKAMSRVLIEGPWSGSELIQAIEQSNSRSSSDDALATSMLCVLGRPDLAWMRASEGLKSNPDDSLLRMSAIRAAGILGEPSLIDSIPLDPPQPIAEAERVGAMVEAGEAARARILADMAVARFPGSPEVLEARGRLGILMRAKDNAAVRDLLQAIQGGIDDSSVWLLALLQAGPNPGDEVQSAIRQTRAFVTKAVDVDRLLAAENAMALGRFSEAESILRDLSQIPELREVVIPNLFVTWRAQGRFEFARSWLDDRIASQPAVVSWRQARMWLARELDELPQYVEELLELNSNSSSGQYQALLLEAATFLDRIDLKKGIIRDRLLRQPKGPGRSIALLELIGREDPETLAKKILDLSSEKLTRNQRRRTLELIAYASKNSRSQLAMVLSRDFLNGTAFITAEELAAAMVNLDSEGQSQLLDSARPVQSGGEFDDASWFRIASQRAQLGDVSMAAKILWFYLSAIDSFDGEKPSPLLRALFGYALISDWGSDRIIESFDLLSQRGINVAASLEMSSISDRPWVLVAGGMASTLGRQDEALQFLEEGYRRGGAPSTLMNNLGFTLLEQSSNRDRAESLILEANRMNPQGTSELDSLGWLRYMQGRDDFSTDGALFYLKKSVLNRRLLGDQVPVEVLMHLGDASWRAGKNEEALSAWNQILELRGANDEDERFQKIYSDWMLEVFGAKIVSPRSLWRDLDGKWVAGARQRLSSCADGKSPKVTPNWQEIDASEPIPLRSD